MAQGSAYFAHFPYLHVSAPIQLGEGVLRSLDFEEFQALDADYAVKSFYEKRSRVFWCTDSLETREGFDALDHFSERAELVHLALLASGAWMPSPNLSVRYQHFSGGTRRLIGAADRSLLLSNAEIMDPTPQQFDTARSALAVWELDGIPIDAPILNPLHALSAVTSASLTRAMSILVLVVALEGALLRDGADKGVVRGLLDSTALLLGDESERAALIRRTYAFRSEYLHGRSLSELHEGDFVALAQLTGEVTLALSGLRSA